MTGSSWTREAAERRLAEVAPLVAKALGDAWAREKRDGTELSHHAGLSHGNERIGLYVAYPHGRLCVSGNLNHVRDSHGESPYLRGVENPRITVALDRAPEQIAREIERRVLPAYREALAKAMEIVAERDDHFAKTAVSAAAVAKVAGAAAGDIDAKGRVSFSRSKRLAEVEGTAECSGEAVSLSLCYLTVAEASAMLSALIACRSATR